MKQPSAPELEGPSVPEYNKLYPSLPVEDGQNYRLQKITEIENKLIKERNDRESLYKKYKRVVNITDGVDTAFLTGGIILGSVGFAIPLLLPLEISAIVLGVLGGGLNLIRRKLNFKVKKHYEIKTLADSKINSIHNLISTALVDNKISEIEFKHILDESEKYYQMKSELHSKHTSISEEEKKKLIEEGRALAMEEFKKKKSNI
jgi:hypothetical protein